MKFKVITPVATEPVTLAQARLQVRLTADDGTDEDTLLTAYITAAREIAEHYTGRALAPQTLEAAMDEFPGCNGVFDLPMPPVVSVTSIKYTDDAGAEQTLATEQYSLSTYSDSCRVSLTYGNYWPTTQCIADAVRVRYEAGFGAEGGPAAPKAVWQAILLMVAWMFEHRGDEMTPDDIQPPAAKALLNTVKGWGF